MEPHLEISDFAVDFSDWEIRLIETSWEAEGCEVSEVFACFSIDSAAKDDIAMNESLLTGSNDSVQIEQIQ